MNGSREMGKPPWDVALLANVRALEARVTDAENERTQLLVDNHQLNQKLRQCRERLENWKLRQAAWHRERDELLQRISQHHAAGALDGMTVGSNCPVCARFTHREPPEGNPS